MQIIVSDTENGVITISDQFDINAATSSSTATPHFTSVGAEYTLSFINLSNVSKFTQFSYDTIGSIESRYLTASYRISRNSTSWTEWLDLTPYESNIVPSVSGRSYCTINNFPTIDTKDPLYIDIRWIRGGSSQIGDIRLTEYSLEGLLDRDEADGESTIQLTSGSTTVIKPPYIYKVFALSDMEIISTGDVSDLDIKYRFSQDNSRSWSNWEPFTKENITTVRINPIRFFQIEYSVTNNSSSTVKIYDINLIGDFQNVTLDYQKMNLYGIRDCCRSNVLGGAYDVNGNFIPNTTGMLGSQACSQNIFTPLTADDKSKLFNPYQQNTAVNLLNKLSNDAQQVFGIRVLYFLTDPDRKGQDHTLHEYQLYNVVCEGEIKVSVDQNNFPDSQISMNQFDMNLFETMEVHITKEQFKQVFGAQRRPAKEDFLYLCDVSRMYQVEHAQQFRSFNNTSIYYKLILKKYNQKSNVQAGTQQIKDKLSQLTKNTTIDELFGIEIAQDKAAVANKDQNRTLTRDPIRYQYLAQIDKELIENSTTIISKSNYDFATVTFSTTAVSYKNLDPVVKVSDNIGFMMWFNIHNYVTDDSYNFFEYYDSVNSLGWKSNLMNDVITVTLNNATYSFDMSPSYATSSTVSAFEEETWYCYVLNIDQRQRKMNQYIYKRNIDDETNGSAATSTILTGVTSSQQDMVPVEYELENITGQITGSDMKGTNIRLFIDVIPLDTHNKILNQNIIRDDSKYLVFADNANTRLVLPRFPLGNEPPGS